MLRQWSREAVTNARSRCAVGEASRNIEMQRNAGFETLSVAAFCVTILTRAGRDGILRYVVRADGVTNSAVAFDGAFVSAYGKREAVPADLPTMATVLPIADRCLRLQETNLRMCGLVGQVLGARAASGELIPVS